MSSDNRPLLDVGAVLAANETAIWAWDAGCERMTWAPAWEPLFGFEPGTEPPSEEPFLGRIHPDDREAVHRALGDAHAGTSLDRTFRIVLPDGAARWVHARGRRCPGENAPVAGTLHEFLSTFETEDVPPTRGRTVGVLTNPDQALRWILDHAPALIRVIAPDGTVLLSNRRGPIRDLIGKNVLHLTQAANQDALRGVLRRVFEDGETVEFEGESPGFGWFAGAYAPIVEDGNVVSAVAIAYDVTERHRKEAETRKRDEWFRTFAESAPLIMWRSNADGLCEYANPAFTEFTGRGISGHLGLEWIEAIHPEDRDAYVEASLAALMGRCGFQSDARTRRHDGEYRLLRTNGTAIRNQQGEFEGHVGTCIDLTEIHRAEDTTQEMRTALAHTLRIETMDQMAVELAHELHQPLAAISVATGAALRYLANGRGEPALLREVIEEAQRQALHAGTVVGEVRDFIRGKSDRIAPLDPNEVVRGVVSLVLREAQRREIRIELDLAADLPRIRGRPVQLQQVLSNLVQNAFLALADSSGERWIRIATRGEGAGQVEIRIADSGPGISPEILEHIFDVYFTTRPDGLGMGLAISRSIVETHGGRLLCDSPPSGGAAFRILLPA